MERYFELRENGEVLYGVITNIPKETTEDRIKERIESETENASLILIDNMTQTEMDIIMDWGSIDYEQELDKDFIDVADSLYLAKKKDLETEVVYTALKEMKNNPNLTISETILIALNNWLK
jgi:hypothetical protein